MGTLAQPLSLVPGLPSLIVVRGTESASPTCASARCAAHPPSTATRANRPMTIALRLMQESDDKFRATISPRFTFLFRNAVGQNRSGSVPPAAADSRGYVPRLPALDVRLAAVPRKLDLQVVDRLGDFNLDAGGVFVRVFLGGQPTLGAVVDRLDGRNLHFMNAYVCAVAPF